MPHSRIPVRPHVLVAFCLGLGVLGMAVLGLLLVPAEHARAAQTTLDTDIKLVAQGGANLDALRRYSREYARQHRGNAPPLAAPSVSPDQADGQITGRLVAGDTGVGNTSVYLRRYRPADNADDTRVLTVTTSTTGTFVFANPPTPPSGYAYYVEFGPQTSNPNLAYFWNSRDVDNYTAGQQVTVGTLDVANTPLIAPADNATVSVPVTFQWTRRARTSDIYSLYFEDLSGNSGTSNALGYIDSIILPSLGSVLRTGEPYLWGIWIDNTAFNGSFGLSQRRTLTFTDAPAQSTGTTTATAPAATTGTPTPTATAAVCQSGTVQVNIENFAFVPASVTVCKGATVRWTNLDTAPHTSTSDTGVWDSGTLTTGQSFSFTFNTTGTFPYHCTIHPNMHGVINVVDAPTATATATATGTAGATGTATVQATGTPTVGATGTATAQATGTPTVGATGTATAQATGTATVGATGTATTAATGTATAPAVMTGTATLSAPATTGTPTPTSTTGVCQSGTVQVNIQNFAFVPATVTVCQGATVRWTNLDSVQHTSTSDTGVWDSGLLSQGQSFSFTFNTAGTYPYHCTPHPNMRGTIIVVPAAAVTPTTTGTAPAAATGTATAQPTVMMTGTPTVGATGTATAQPTAMMTGTATAQPTVMMTGTATVQATAAATGTATTVATSTATVAATGTATAQATGTATALPTGTATAAPTSTATRAATGTATAQATGTATVQPTRTATVQPTGTATVRPTPTAISCGGGNLCAGVIVVRAFIDFGCDGFFNRGTDYPLYGSTVTATLSDGTRLVSVVDENGNAVITGVNLAATGTVQVSIDSPPLPTWVQQASYGLAPCGNSPTTMTLQRSNFGLFGVAFTDFRFGLTQR